MQYNTGYNQEGYYIYEGNGGYEDWPAFKIEIEEKEMDLNNDVILNLETAN